MIISRKKLYFFFLRIFHPRHKLLLIIYTLLREYCKESIQPLFLNVAWANNRDMTKLYKDNDKKHFYKQIK